MLREIQRLQRLLGRAAGEEGGGMIISLKLSADESLLLKELSREKDMTKTAILRQSLRLFEVVNSRHKQGKIMCWKKPNGEIEETIFIGGCDGHD